MRPGRPKKPTALRKLEGNPSKRPYPKNEPQPDLSIPDCPDWLLPEAKEEWERVAPQLNKLGLLTQLDRTALAAYCQSYAKWAEAERWLKEHGPVYPILNEDGSVRYLQQAPQVGIANQCLKQIRAFCSEFGLSPASRCRIELPSGKGEDKFLDQLITKMG